MSARCGGCPHAAHKNACRGKAKSGCVPMTNAATGSQVGIVCYGSRKPACPCAWRECKCGAAVADAILLTDTDLVVPVLRGSARDPAGRLEVWTELDGRLWAREIVDGEPIREGRWRGVEHDGPCQTIHAAGYKEAI